MYIYIYVYIYIHVYFFIYIVYFYILTYGYKYTYIYTYVYIYIYIHVYIFVFIYRYIYIYICQQTCVFKFKIVFLRGNEKVPPAFKQYKNQGNASNLVQSHFGSPHSFELESGIAPLVPRGFDPACCGLNQLPPSRS